jgi:hypothetical protein
VQEEPRVFRVLGQGRGHGRARLGHPARGRQRPGASILREDVVSHRELALGEEERLRGFSPTRREEERDGPRIRETSALHDLPLDGRSFGIALPAPQSVGEHPLVFGQRVECRRAPEHPHGVFRAICRKEDSSFHQQRRRVFRLKPQRGVR